VSESQETSHYGDFSRYRPDTKGEEPELRPARRAGRPSKERGLSGWLALVVLLVIAGIGGLIDQISGAAVQGAFNWALILASLVAILIVRRSKMFTIIVAPPLVYFVASAGKLYITSNGLKDRGALTDAAANWLVYGFPAIAGATAIVLLIAGIRIITRR
jgi:hypothetical protein